MPSVVDFRNALNKILKSAQVRGLPHVDVRAGDLHRQVGGYPGPGHRMPVCCDAMRGTIQAGDIVLEEPPSGLGASLKIRYKLPRKCVTDEANECERIGRREFKENTQYLPKRVLSKDFEKLAREILSEHFRTSLTEGEVSGIPKVFDMVDLNREIVGDAKYLTMVRGKRIPPAKFSMISEYVWLLEKVSATHKFLVFGNDRRVPEEWLKKYGHLIRDVVFFFLDEQTRELKRLDSLACEESRAVEKTWIKLEELEEEITRLIQEFRRVIKEKGAPSTIAKLDQKIMRLIAVAGDRERLLDEKLGEQTVCFVQEIPAIVGSDMKTYGPFKRGDIAKLPPRNARALIKQGVAVRADGPTECARVEQIRCPKCSSMKVKRIEENYDSPEADELGVYEYECLDCGYVWEVEW